MSVTAIPNQPIGFVPSRLQGALCGDPVEFTPVVAGDLMNFQMQYVPCGSDGLLANPTFDGPSSWFYDGWTFGENEVCRAGDNSNTIPPLFDTSFNPTVGVQYFVEVIVTSIRGSVNWAFGGVGGVISAPGSYRFSVVAVNTAGMFFRPVGSDASMCFIYAQAMLQNSEPTVDIIDLDGNVLESFDFTTDPDNFDFDGLFMTFSVTASEDWLPCFRFRVTDPCDDAVYTSQAFTFANADLTIPVRACNAGAAMGFSDDFQAMTRLVAKISRPKYDYDEAVTRGTNGYVDNYFVQRKTTMDLCVDDAGEVTHRFLSTLPLYDHVYFRQDEYRVKAESYEPGYGDVWDSAGPIIIAIEPKREDVRKVRCGPDVFGGCPPPPNYLVQGTGPNNDYVLLQGGGRIRLHGA